MQDVSKLYAVGTTTYINECSPDMLSVAARLSSSQGHTVSCAKSAMTIYGTGNPDLKPE
jgi:hypothetical protein